jgi:hypothetical protein
MADTQVFTEWCPELEKALAEPFPREQHTQKGNKGTFVSVHHYVARLNALVGVQGWSMPQPSAFHAGNKLTIALGITILGVTKWNVGDEMEDHGEPVVDGETGREKVVDFGSSCTNAYAQAFKRCMAYGFRCGLYLYDKDWTRKYLANKNSNAPRQQSNGAGPTKVVTTNEPTCPACDGVMWNNLERKANGQMKQTAPDFKCKSKTCDGVFWPGEWPPEHEERKDGVPPAGEPALAADAQVAEITALRAKVAELGGDASHLDPLIKAHADGALTAIRATNAITKAQRWISEQPPATVGADGVEDDLPF